MRALQIYYPDDYRKLEARLRALPASASRDEIRSAAVAGLGEVILRQRPKADPETSLAFYEVARMEAAALQSVDPKQCADFEDGLEATSLGAVVTPQMLAKEVDATSRLLAQTASHPSAPAQPITHEGLLKLSVEALAKLPDAEQDVAIRVLRESRSAANAEEGRAMCDFDLALTEVVLARPRAEAGELVRAIWAIK